MKVLHVGHFHQSRPVWILLAFLSALILFLSFLKGIAFPGGYVSTHYLFAYDYGFSKRALLGWLFRMVHDGKFPSFQFISIFSFSVIGLMLVVMGWLWFRLRQPLWLLMPFLASPGMVMIFNLSGHLDLVCYALSLILIGLHHSKFFSASSFRGAALVIFTFMTCTVMLFIHEAMLLITIPVALFSLYFFLLKLLPSNVLKVRRGIIGMFLALAVIAGCVSKLGVLPSYEDGYVAAALRADFAPTRYAFEILTHSSAYTVDVMSLIYQNRLLAMLSVISILKIAPFAYFYLALVLRKDCFRWGDSFEGLAAKGVAVAPMLLYCIAYDFQRWSAEVLINAFLVFLIVGLNRPGSHLQMNRSGVLLIVVLVATGVIQSFTLIAPSRTPFLDSSDPSKPLWALSFAGMFDRGYKQMEDYYRMTVSLKNQCWHRQPNGLWCDFEDIQNGRLVYKKAAVQ